MKTDDYVELHVTNIDAGILVAHFAGHGKVNTLTDALWNDLARLLDVCEANAAIEGLVIASAKPGVFLAGAELREFIDVTPQRLRFMLQRAHAVFERMETLRVPVVAAVAGMALGGGLELLMAAHGVAAVDEPRIKFGLPETTLGLIPGAGGTQRLPLYAGVLGAVDIICSGRPFSPQAAHSLGIVDRLVEPDALLDEAVALVRELAAKGHRSHRLRLNDASATAMPPTRLLGEVLQRESVNRDLPACQAACKAIVMGAYLPFPEGLELESALFAELMHAPATQEKIRSFLA